MAVSGAPTPLASEVTPRERAPGSPAGGCWAGPRRKGPPPGLPGARPLMAAQRGGQPAQGPLHKPETQLHSVPVTWPCTLTELVVPSHKLRVSAGLPSPPSPDMHLCWAMEGLAGACQGSFPRSWSSNETHKVGNSMPGRGKSSARTQQQGTGKGVSLVWGLQAWGIGLPHPLFSLMGAADWLPWSLRHGLCTSLPSILSPAPHSQEGAVAISCRHRRR